MEQTIPITLSQTDYERLLTLARNSKAPSTEILEDEVLRATIIPDRELPDGVVAMNSTVRFVDQATGSESVVTLVYPQEANIDQGKVSILAPVGIALIGLRVGQSIRWPMPNGKDRNLRVVSVTPAQSRASVA